MYLSINWLKDFIQYDLSPEELADKLIMAGIEVEQITHIGAEWNNIVVGEIIDIKPHPHADKLSLTRIQAGDRTYPVVCGASNIAIGQKVPLALEGATLPGGIKIKETKIRGELSLGMLCSEQELALSHDASGIMILPSDIKPGASFAQALKLTDTILDLSITPNRPDCLSVIGMAREIAAILDIPFTKPEIVVQENGESIGALARVEIIDPDLCPRYTARIIANIRIGHSPLWMRRRLETSGIRSINNAVDVTNYVLLEWGQPLHAFDFDLLTDHKIIVKKALPQERFITLDGTERTLPPDALMICDGERPVALGGIMGGQNSEVHAETKRIFLESAYFLPASIRKTSRAVNLKTEASLRFEKGVDINAVIPSLNRAAALIAQLCGGTVARGTIDCYPHPLPAPASITFSTGKMRKLIGTSLADEQISRLLKRLHMSVSSAGSQELRVTPPTFRVDVHEPVDLVEEVARLNGYDQVPLTYPRIQISAKPPSAAQLQTARVRELMVSRGFYEVINYSFADPVLLSRLNLPEHDQRLKVVTILNPLSEEQSTLRTCLIPSLLVNLADNLRHKNTSIKLFEISTVFFSDPLISLPLEKRRLSGLMSGSRFDENWDLPRNKLDFFDIKGCVETLLDTFSLSSVRFIRENHESFMHPHNFLSLVVEGTRIGFLGEVHPEVLDAFSIDQAAYIFDLDFDFICSLFSDKIVSYTPLPRHPAIYRDIALLVDEHVTYEELYNTIITFKNKLIDGVELFDCFCGGSIPAGKKSLAYRIRFQSYNRNLTDDEVNKIQEKLLIHLKKEVGAELR
jgi:phenylalanyl-tRNA synthetase beta chain